MIFSSHVAFDLVSWICVIRSFSALRGLHNIEFFYQVYCNFMYIITSALCVKKENVWFYPDCHLFFRSSNWCMVWFIRSSRLCTGSHQQICILYSKQNLYLTKNSPYVPFFKFKVQIWPNKLVHEEYLASEHTCSNKSAWYINKCINMCNISGNWDRYQ